MENRSRSKIGGNRRLPTDSEIPREPDEQVLCESAYGPYRKPTHADPIARKLDDLREELWEVFKRMDKPESEKLARFIGMLSSLSVEEIERLYKIIKVFGFFRWLFGGFKWLIGFFVAGIAAMAAGGQQIENIIGYIRSTINFIKAVK